MYNIRLYNSIAKNGIKQFGEKYNIVEDETAEDAILVRSSNLHSMVLGDNLKAIARAGAGTNNIPIEKCTEKGIAVFNTPGANANAVKELVMVGLLMSARPLYEALKWTSTLDGRDDIEEVVEREKKRFKGHELEGRNIGVIGLGAIGIKVANLALEFGMNVYGYDPFISVDAAWNLSRNIKRATDINELLKNSDYITLHLPLNENTKHIINNDTISQMKDGVHILNFARGGLVDDDAIIENVGGKVGSYVTDFPNKKLAGVNRVYNIPHLGASTFESEEKCAVMAAKELMEYLENGNIINSVNMPNAYMERSGKIRIGCFHRNVVGMISKISDILTKRKLNITNLINKSKGEYAYTLIDLDSDGLNGAVDELKEIDEMIRVQVYL